MQKWFIVFMAVLISITLISPGMLNAEQKGDPVCGHTDPSKMMTLKGVHGGAGSMQFMSLLDGRLFETNLLYIHTGLIPPKSGIGEHIHNTIERRCFSLSTLPQNLR